MSTIRFTVPRAARVPSHASALALGVFANVLWASSFVLVKFTLPYMGPLTIGALRYFIAFLVLLPFIARRRSLPSTRQGKVWLNLAWLGISAYTIGNGAFFWALKYLPATTVSFFLSLSPLLMLFAGRVWLKERPTRLQVFGVVICLGGGVLFFSPGVQGGQLPGILVTLVGVIAFLIFGVLGRALARDHTVDPLNLTAIPLAIGGALLLLIALPLEGLPANQPLAWLVVTWMAVANTALAYLLYNYALQSLTALEINVLFNLSPLGTALFAWLILGESLGAIQLLGMAVVIGGVFIVQQVRIPALRHKRA